MDPKVEALLDKAKDLVDKTGKAAAQVADTASKKANEMAKSTHLNMKLFDLNAECDAMYKELGKLVYDTHAGLEIPENALETCLNRIDENRAKVADLRDSIDEMKTVVTCPSCGRQCAKEDIYCAACGAQL